MHAYRVYMLQTHFELVTKVQSLHVTVVDHGNFVSV